MPDNSFDFSAASAAAAQSLQQPETPTPAPDPAPAGQPVTPDPDTPTPLDAKQLFKVKDNGAEVEVSLEDLLSGHLRHRDYTRKTMELAEQRKSFEAQVTAAQQREAKINAFLRDAEQVARYYTFLTGQQVTTQQAAQMMAGQNPQQVQQPSADLSAVRQELQQEFGQFAQASQAELAKMQAAIRAREEADLDREITGHIKGILKDDKLKVLEDIGDFDEIAEFLCAQATKLGPVQTLDQAKAAILQVAQAKAERLGDRRKELLKTEAAKKADLSNKGIEPPGGKGVTPSPITHKLGSKELTKAAQDFVEGLAKK